MTNVRDSGDGGAEPDDKSEEEQSDSVVIEICSCLAEEGLVIWIGTCEPGREKREGTKNGNDDC